MNDLIKFCQTYGQQIESLINVIQALVIIAATIFTAIWTYKTFAHKEKIKELKELKKLINIYHQKIQIFCAQVRKDNSPDADKQEIQEKLELANIHNQLVSLHDLNLYTRQEIRKKIQNIVGLWIINDRFNLMQYRNSSKLQKEERDKLWTEFDKEYKEVKGIIDKEAERYT